MIKTKRLNNFLSEGLTEKIVKELIDNISPNHLADSSISYLRECYERIKGVDEWPEIYDSLKSLSILKAEVLDIILEDARKHMVKPRLINNGVRIMEKASKRAYPFHQEYWGIEARPFLIYWIALHDIDSGEGGLLLAENSANKELPHYINPVGYPILEDQDKWNKCANEITFKNGDCLVFDDLTPHATSRNQSEKSRWALIYRVTSA